MTDTTATAKTRAMLLREEFDASFAVRPVTDTSARVDLLLVRLSASRYALRLEDVASVQSEARVASLPGSPPELLGVTSRRGAIVPVYDLGALVAGAPSHSARWLAICAQRPLALAFDAFEGHLRAPLDALVPVSQPDTRARHVREVVHAAAGVVPIVDLASLGERIGAAASRDPVRKEH